MRPQHFQAIHNHRMSWVGEIQFLPQPLDSLSSGWALLALQISDTLAHKVYGRAGAYQTALRRFDDSARTPARINLRVSSNSCANSSFDGWFT